MDKIFKNKKIILLILSLILLFILTSNYIKTTEVELDLISEQENKVNKKELLIKPQKQELKVKKEQEKIESIALIKEIKDPFQLEEKHNKKAEENTAVFDKAKALKINTKKDLLYLEKNIIAENIIDENPNMDISAAKKKKSVKTKKSAESNEQALKKIRLNFELLGIIRNKSNSAALFLYQGQNVLKKENEKIDMFKIEKITNKSVIISYQNYKRKLHLWEEKNNENEN